jgi:hypothetical protein
VLNVRAKWFPQPSPERAVDVRPKSVAPWECRLAFSLGWTLPAGAALEALWPLRDRLWYDYEKADLAGYNLDGFNEFHRLLGHATLSPDELTPVAPLPAGASLTDYEPLLRLTFDNNAGFSWGTNWSYLIVPRADLARGELSRVVVAHGNV